LLKSNKKLLLPHTVDVGHIFLSPQKKPKETKIKNPWLGNTCILI